MTAKSDAAGRPLDLAGSQEVTENDKPLSRSEGECLSEGQDLRGVRNQPVPVAVKTEDEEILGFLVAFYGYPDRATALRNHAERIFDDVELLRAYRTLAPAIPREEIYEETQDVSRVRPADEEPVPVLPEMPQGVLAREREIARRLVKALQNVQSEWWFGRDDHPLTDDFKVAEQITAEALAASRQGEPIPADVHLQAIREIAAHSIAVGDWTAEEYARRYLDVVGDMHPLPKSAARPGEPWQPIASVPQDRRWVLVWQEDQEYSIYRFGPDLITEPDDVQWTHWLPLPPGPKDADQ